MLKKVMCCTLGFLVLFVLCIAPTSSQNSTSSACHNECEWTPWLAWDCTDCCGRSPASKGVAYRQRGICCSSPADPIACLANCGRTRIQAEDVHTCQDICPCLLTTSSSRGDTSTTLPTTSMRTTRITTVPVTTTTLPTTSMRTTRTTTVPVTTTTLPTTSMRTTRTTTVPETKTALPTTSERTTRTTTVQATTTTLPTTSVRTTRTTTVPVTTTTTFDPCSQATSSTTINATSYVASKAANKANTPPVAFTAHLSSTINPLQPHQPITFDKVVSNVGGAYNPINGHFTAPVSGIYSFTLTVTNTPGHSASLTLMKNGSPLSVSRAHGTAQMPGQWETTTISVSLQLNKGDQVWAQNEKTFPDVGTLGGYTYSSLTGFLVNAID